MKKKIYLKPTILMTSLTEKSFIVMSGGDGFDSDQYDNEFDFGG